MNKAYEGEHNKHIVSIVNDYLVSKSKNLEKIFNKMSEKAIVINNESTFKWITEEEWENINIDKKSMKNISAILYANDDLFYIFLYYIALKYSVNETLKIFNSPIEYFIKNYKKFFYKFNKYTNKDYIFKENYIIDIKYF